MYAIWSSIVQAISKEILLSDTSSKLAQEICRGATIVGRYEPTDFHPLPFHNILLCMCWPWSFHLIHAKILGLWKQFLIGFCQKYCFICRRLTFIALWCLPNCLILRKDTLLSAVACCSWYWLFSNSCLRYVARKARAFILYIIFIYFIQCFDDLITLHLVDFEDFWCLKPMLWQSQVRGLVAALAAVLLGKNWLIMVGHGHTVCE